MSILRPAPTIDTLVVLLGLAVGVAVCAHPHRPAPSAGTLEPIGREDTRSICAALCIAGLGGEPCGAPCATLAPRNGSQSGGGSAPSGSGGGGGASAVAARRDACPLLCKYRLGEPLCACSESVISDRQHAPPHVVVDFHRICNYFCFEHDYHIYGCPVCDVYKMQRLDRRVRPTEMDIDWMEWCKQQCAGGTGGAACACNPPLPMMLDVNTTNTDTA